MYEPQAKEKLLISVWFCIESATLFGFTLIVAYHKAKKAFYSCRLITENKVVSWNNETSENRLSSDVACIYPTVSHGASCSINFNGLFSWIKFISYFMVSSPSINLLVPLLFPLYFQFLSSLYSIWFPFYCNQSFLSDVRHMLCGHPNVLFTPFYRETLCAYYRHLIPMGVLSHSILLRLIAYYYPTPTVQIASSLKGYAILIKTAVYTNFVVNSNSRSVDSVPWEVWSIPFAFLKTTTVW